jgi:archaemetzincin
MYDAFLKKIIILLITCVWLSCTSHEHPSVALQPYDDFDQTLIKQVSSSINKIYGFEAVVLKHKPMPREAYTTVKTPRYRADKLLRILQEEKSDTITYILGLATEDISTTKRDANGNIKLPEEKYTDWGVFGLGYLPGKSCVVSTFRLRNPEYKLLQRLQKVCVHEIGHNLGLDHCKNKMCVMADAAESIKTIDQVKLDLCVACKKKISN